MTTKNLAILGVAAVVLGGAAWYCNSGRAVRTPSIVGEKILPAFDVSDVARIEIGGAKKVQLVADDKGWKLQSLYGYPADVTKIRENLLKLTELKVGQVANGKKIASPVTVDIQDAAGKSLVVRNSRRISSAEFQSRSVTATVTTSFSTPLSITDAAK